MALKTFLNRGNTYRYLVIIALIVFCILAALYVNLALHTSSVYPHFFYLPVILTGVWFYKKSFWVAMLLGSIHLALVLADPKPKDLTVEVYSALVRLIVLLIIAWIVAIYAKRNPKTVIRRQPSPTGPGSLVYDDASPAIPEKPIGITRQFDYTEASPAMALFRVQTFGPLKLLVDGVKPAAINWRTAKTRDLLAYLIHIQEPVEREKIIEDIWAGFEREKAITLFHTTLHNLRQALNRINRHDCLVYQNKKYQLQLENAIIDRRLFEDLNTRSINKELSPGEAANLLEEAVAFYKGDYLAELDYDWVRPEQERLKQIYISARRRLAGYYLEKGEYLNSIHHLQILIDLNPLNEETHCLLMTAYAGLGDWLALERQYQKLTELLKNELGLAPSATTRNTFYQLFQR
ncbi:MAG: hypothetical protein K6U80_01985 [Firmicutes bacterium]|nr:hypothetical protein [Bacillota bacterium]